MRIFWKLVTLSSGNLNNQNFSFICMKRTALIVIVMLIVVGIAGRLLPHLPNATPIAALAFVGSLHFGRKVAFLLPLSVLLVTDIIVGFYSLGIMLSVYGSFTLIAALSWYLQKRKSLLTLGYLVMSGSVSFFLITNAAVWWFSPWYEKSLSGLLYSYELGLPFLRNMLLGDLVYTFTLMGAVAAVPHLVRVSKRSWASKTTHQISA
jgi:hypothetical protein